jgi:hypothetical protein
MRPRVLPALTVPLLVCTEQQGVAKRWEFDCKYERFAQT